MVIGHVVAKLIGAVGELALVSIGTEALFSEIPAEGAFDFGRIMLVEIIMVGVGSVVGLQSIGVVTLGGDVKDLLLRLAAGSDGRSLIYLEVHKNDYRLDSFIL